MNIKRISFSLMIVAALSLSAFAACGNGAPQQGVIGGTNQDENIQVNKAGQKYYVSERYGYTLEIPEEIYKACDITEQGEGDEVYFSLKKGGDMVMAVVTVPNREQKGDSLGLRSLGSSEEFTTYIQMPTCGTLNDESSRDLWNGLCEKARNIDSRNIIFA